MRSPVPRSNRRQTVLKLVATLLQPTTDGVEALPIDCWRLVFENLSQDDLKAVSLTCKDFLANSNIFRKSLKVIHPKVSMLSQHLKRFTQLKRIDLSGFPGDENEEALSEIARSELSLESLELDVTVSNKKRVTLLENKNKRVTEHGIGLLLRNRPNLEALSLSHIMRSSTSNITIENSISHAKALTSLTFSRMDIPDTILMEIAKAKLRLKGDLGNLTHIQLSSCKMTSSTFLLLLTNCPWLVEIKMSKSEVNGEVGNILLCKHHSIRNIHFYFCKFSEALVKQLTLLFPNLNDLVLGYHCHTFQGIRVAEVILTGDEINSLEVLEVSNSSGIDGEATAKSCPKLRSLGISDCKKVTTEGIKHIVETITSLRCLSIDNCGANASMKNRETNSCAVVVS
ncbi:Leucine-rich repeat, cysteine-containing subtype [Corchorus olitorius]|uniref:Leucine-rich repeat, cysteine-containing subtype n=1 Tax=Corchorus olitorius TaxID=93759 RepID=A0A1R3GGT0_9ROSI|nr:Leucine-rich repeat, cysteine-containing subtype [Corchorus olitorius]